MIYSTTGTDPIAEDNIAEVEAEAVEQPADSVDEADDKVVVDVAVGVADEVVDEAVDDVDDVDEAVDDVDEAIDEVVEVDDVDEAVYDVDDVDEAVDEVVEVVAEVEPEDADIIDDDEEEPRGEAPTYAEQLTAGVKAVIDAPIDSAVIHWFIDKRINAYLGTLAKDIATTPHALYLTGSNHDIKHTICKYLTASNPVDTAIIGLGGEIASNYPYEAIESVKSGIFCDLWCGRGTMTFESPRVVVLARQAPNPKYTTKGRWMVHEYPAEIVA